MPDDIKLESLSLLAKIYTSQNQLGPAISLLQQAYDMSTQQAYWHCRIIFQIIVRCSIIKNEQSLTFVFQSIYHSQDDFNTSLYYVDRGIEYCARINAFFCQILFQLTKAMVRIDEKSRFDDTDASLSPILVENFG